MNLNQSYKYHIKGHFGLVSEIKYFGISSILVYFLEYRYMYYFVNAFMSYSEYNIIYFSNLGWSRTKRGYSYNYFKILISFHLHETKINNKKKSNTILANQVIIQ